MKKIIIIFLMFSLINSVIAQEQGIVIKKTAPEKIKLGEILPVTISVRNNLRESIGVTLRETIGGAEIIDLAGARSITPGSPPLDIIALAPPHYKWTFSLGPDSERNITYRIKPLDLGKFMIGPTTVYTLKGTFRSNSVSVWVKCNENGACELNLGENSITCPEDCPPGSRDGLCNSIEEGICDPDCPLGVDPDCIPAICGDGRCERLKSEDYENCPEDCPRPVRCGDGICEKNENYGNCKRDCPSGSRDGYCDALSDGVCDPDCRMELDPDCPVVCGNGVCEYSKGESYLTCPKDCPPPEHEERGYPHYLIFIVILVIVAIAIGILYIKRRRYE